MKKMTKLVSMLLVVALLVIAPGLGTLTAKAATPLTYSIGYDTNLSEWRWQILPTFDTKAGSEPISKLDSYVKDGDIVVVYNEGTTNGLTFNLSAKLSNLTVIGSAAPIVCGAATIDEFFALQGCTTAVNGTIKNAHVYDNCIVTFNNNVDFLEIISKPGTYNLITAAGTVAHAKSTYDVNVHYEVYNVAAGKFVSEYTVLQTDPQYYSTTPTGTAAATTPAAPSTTPSAPSGEYDDVPKTGEAAYIYMLCGLSLICFLGSRKLRRA